MPRPIISTFSKCSSVETKIKDYWDKVLRLKKILTESKTKTENNQDCFRLLTEADQNWLRPLNKIRTDQDCFRLLTHTDQYLTIFWLKLVNSLVESLGLGRYLYLLDRDQEILVSTCWNFPWNFWENFFTLFRNKSRHVKVEADIETSLDLAIDRPQLSRPQCLL